MSTNIILEPKSFSFKAVLEIEEFYRFTFYTCRLILTWTKLKYSFKCLFTTLLEVENNLYLPMNIDNWILYFFWSAYSIYKTGHLASNTIIIKIQYNFHILTFGLVYLVFTSICLYAYMHLYAYMVCDVILFGIQMK